MRLEELRSHAVFLAHVEKLCLGAVNTGKPTIGHAYPMIDGQHLSLEIKVRQLNDHQLEVEFVPCEPFSKSRRLKLLLLVGGFVRNNKPFAIVDL